MQILFDSNVWIAFLNNQDSQHEKAVEIFKVNRKQIVIPEYVVLEVASVLQIRVNQETANTFLRKIEGSESVQILLSDQRLYQKANYFFQSQSSQKLAFVDCALLALSSEMEVITFDRALLNELKG